MPRKSTLPPLDLTGAKMAVVGADVLAARRPTRGNKERSKQQKALDVLVQKAYEKWVSAGRPEKFWESPGGHIRITEAQVVQVQRAIHASGRFLNMKIRFGKVQVEDGYADVVFSAADRPAESEGSEA